MVLRPGDWLHFDGQDHQAVGLAGMTVRLAADDRGNQVLLLGHLLSAQGFALINAQPAPQVEPLRLIDALPAEDVADARRWQAHVVEVETGLSPDALPCTTPREGYDPARHTLALRQQAKAAELGVTARTIETKPARYSAQGLWDLVDQHAARAAGPGRPDPRVVEAARQIIAEQTQVSTGTRSRLIRRVIARVEELHGPGAVPLSGRSAFYELVDRLSVGLHTFGSAVTRRQLANRPDTAFTPTLASRPCEQVQFDSTPIDVMVLAVDGVPVRAHLTIAMDVATRTICAAVLRPVGTKAVDAALLLAKMLVPEPIRPGWTEALRMTASRLPHERLVEIDARMREAAARPVIVPAQVVIDHGHVFVSDTLTRACERLWTSIEPARKGTPTDTWSRRPSPPSRPCSPSTAPGSRAPTHSSAAAPSPPSGRWRS